MKIRRTKTGEGGPDGLPVSTRTHWARKVDPSGCVTEWGDSFEAANDFDAETAHKVAAHYAARPGAGEVQFPSGPTDEPPPHTEAAPDCPGEPDRDSEELQAALCVITEQLEVIASLRQELEQANQKRKPGRPAKAKEPEPPPAPTVSFIETAVSDGNQALRDEPGLTTEPIGT